MGRPGQTQVSHFELGWNGQRSVIPSDRDGEPVVMLRYCAAVAGVLAT
jgi:hypothetical protein